jgi:hypothetical protein
MNNSLRSLWFLLFNNLPPVAVDVRRLTNPKSQRDISTNRGRNEGLNLAPPSEPDWRISRIRLSS